MVRKLIKIVVLSFLTIIGIAILSKCSNPNLQDFKPQLQIVDTLISHFKEGDSLSVKKMMGVDLSDVGKNEEMLDYDVKKFHQYLNDYKIGSKDDFKFKKYSKKNPMLVDITVPFKNETSGKKIYLNVSFTKYIGNGKILDFKIIDY